MPAVQPEPNPPRLFVDRLKAVALKPMEFWFSDFADEQGVPDNDVEPAIRESLVAAASDLRNGKANGRVLPHLFTTMRCTFLGQVFQSLRNQLCGFARGHGVKADKVEDAVGDSIADVFATVQKGVVIENPKAFVYLVLRRKCLKHVFNKIDRDEPLSEDGLPDDGQSPSETVLRHELARKIESAIQELSEQQRQVVILYFYEGYSVEEIARILGVSVPTVKEHLRRAKEKLRNKLQDLFPPEFP